MAGVGVGLAPNLKMDIGYRYLNMGDQKSGAITCDVPCNSRETKHFGLATHDLRVGLRWAFNDGFVPGPGPQPVYAPPLVRKY